MSPGLSIAGASFPVEALLTELRHACIIIFMLVCVGVYVLGGESHPLSAFLASSFRIYLFGALHQHISHTARAFDQQSFFMR